MRSQLSIAMTSAFLLARPAFGLACFFALAAFVFLAAFRLVFAASGTGVPLLFSTESLVIGFSSTGLRSSQSITPAGRNCKANVQDWRWPDHGDTASEELARTGPFLRGRQNAQSAQHRDDFRLLVGAARFRFGLLLRLGGLRLLGSLPFGLCGFRHRRAAVILD